jgi:3-dehydroquinate dehydratase type I
MICVSVGDISQIEEATRLGADLIELRLDLIERDPGTIFPLLPEKVRTVVTCRPGAFGDRQRSEYLMASVELGASYIDIEVESSDRYASPIVSHALGKGAEVIVSFHDFRGTPARAELRRIMEQCADRGGEIVKIATQVVSRDDIFNLLSLYDIPGRKVVIGMGPLGRITRVMAPYLGSEFTFASIGGGGETAPGQLSLEQLKEIYNVINTR